MTDTDTKPLSPSAWVAGFAVLILCQLLGEALVSALRLVVPGLSFPGAVAGMMLLLVLLIVRKGRAPAVLAAASGLLGILSLLFVPSAVGVMQYGDLIAAWGLQLLVAVVVSTVLTLLVTVGAFLATERYLSRRQS